MTPQQRQIAIRKLRLPFYARLVLYDLAARADEQGQCFPSINTLADENDLGRRTVDRALAYLRAAELIEQNRSPDRINCIFTLRLEGRSRQTGVKVTPEGRIKKYNEVDPPSGGPSQTDDQAGYWTRRGVPICERCQRNPRYAEDRYCQPCWNELHPPPAS